MKIPATVAAPATIQRARADMVLSEDQGDTQFHLDAVLRLARRHDYEREHTHHVTFLAMRLYDDLTPLHRLGSDERFWLKCAALLHDIGKSECNRGHHKKSLKIVLQSPVLPFDKRNRLIIGSIARYHTKALPKKRHSHFALLSTGERSTVRQLASILRVADALDRSHRLAVQTLWCELSPRHILLRCALRESIKSQFQRIIEQRANEKGRLLEKVFSRKLLIDWQ